MINKKRDNKENEKQQSLTNPQDASIMRGAQKESEFNEENEFNEKRNELEEASTMTDPDHPIERQVRDGKVANRVISKRASSIVDDKEFYNEHPDLYHDLLEETENEPEWIYGEQTADQAQVSNMRDDAIKFITSRGTFDAEHDQQFSIERSKQIYENMNSLLKQYKGSMTSKERTGRLKGSAAIENKDHYGADEQVLQVAALFHGVGQYRSDLKRSGRSTEVATAAEADRFAKRYNFSKRQRLQLYNLLSNNNMEDKEDREDGGKTDGFENTFRVAQMDLETKKGVKAQKEWVKERMSILRSKDDQERPDSIREWIDNEEERLDEALYNFSGADVSSSHTAGIREKKGLLEFLRNKIESGEFEELESNINIVDIENKQNNTQDDDKAAEAEGSVDETSKESEIIDEFEEQITDDNEENLDDTDNKEGVVGDTAEDIQSVDNKQSQKKQKDQESEKNGEQDHSDVANISDTDKQQKTTETATNTEDKEGEKQDISNQRKQRDRIKGDSEEVKKEATKDDEKDADPMPESNRYRTKTEEMNKDINEVVDKVNEHEPANINKKNNKDEVIDQVNDGVNVYYSEEKDKYYDISSNNILSQLKQIKESDSEEWSEVESQLNDIKIKNHDPKEKVETSISSIAYTTEDEEQQKTFDDIEGDELNDEQEDEIDFEYSEHEEQYKEWMENYIAPELQDKSDASIVEPHNDWERNTDQDNHKSENKNKVNQTA